MPKRVKSATHMAQKLRYNERSRKTAYDSGSRWSVGDTLRVMAQNKPDRYLALFLGRSIQAIQAKRASELFKKGGIYV